MAVIDHMVTLAEIEKRLAALEAQMNKPTAYENPVEYELAIQAAGRGDCKLLKKYLDRGGRVPKQ
jgi:hypothetical protein